MPITELLERNADQFGNDVCLVEINPEIKENRRVTWKEYELIEATPRTHYRREITWNVFDENLGLLIISLVKMRMMSFLQCFLMKLDI